MFKIFILNVLSIFTFLIKYIKCKQLHHKPPSTGSGGPSALPPG